jgi:2-methylcitrate dehydratase PrpD
LQASAEMAPMLPARHIEALDNGAMSASTRTVAGATLADRLAAWVCDLRFADLPDEVVSKAKLHVLFLIGSACAGKREVMGMRGIDIARRLGGAGGRCTIVGEAHGAAAVDAAFANAAMIMSGDGDDYLLPAGGHPGVVTIPAALALAEQEGRSGSDLLTAIVAGYELLGKLASLQWAWDGQVPRRATIPFGPFGPVAAASRLLGLDVHKTAHAIRYAASMAMGLSENPFGGLYYGYVARNGITAAISAAAGGEMPLTTLEGKRGFFMSFFERIPDGADRVADRLGHDWEMTLAELKTWGTTGMNYAAIELLLELMAEHRLTADNVERIVVDLSSERVNHAAGHAHGPFSHSWQADSSCPYQLAIALLDGDIDPARSERFDGADAADVMRRIEVRLVDAPLQGYAALHINTTDGRLIEGVRERYRADPAERLAWLRRNVARHAYPPERFARIEDAVSRLDAVPDLSELSALLRG